VIIPVDNQKHAKYAKDLYMKLKENKIRVLYDDSEERLGKKIREAQINKIPYQVIIGDDEVKSKKISYRQYGKTDTNKASINDFVKLIKKQVAEKE